MARTVEEWKGKTDDSAPSKACKLRILSRQDNKCALTGHQFVPGDNIEFDHITALWLGGKNCESNLHAVLGEAHKRKTKVEAAVRAKTNRDTAKHLGITKPAGKLRSAPFPRPDKPQREGKPPLAPRNLFTRISP
jgi:5-methylcytosine-specific restriction enzyme A